MSWGRNFFNFDSIGILFLKNKGMAAVTELPPGEAPPEWEKAKQALAAIQQPKKQQQQKQSGKESDSDENAFEKYGGPIGYPPGFNMMYPGYAPPGPGFGYVTISVCIILFIHREIPALTMKLI